MTYFAIIVRFSRGINKLRCCYAYTKGYIYLRIKTLLILFRSSDVFIKVLAERALWLFIVLDFIIIWLGSYRESFIIIIKLYIFVPPMVQMRFMNDQRGIIIGVILLVLVADLQKDFLATTLSILISAYDLILWFTCTL